MKNKIIIAILGTLAAVGIAGFVILKVSPDLFGLCKKDSGIKEDEPKEVSQQSEEVPSGFEEAELNGVKVHYPKGWDLGKPEKTKEDLSGEYPTKTYDGESISSDDYDAIIYALDEDSLKSDKDISDTLDLLLNIYEKKSVEPEAVYAVDIAYLPPPNAGVSLYNPRYAESQNGDWRGFWYVANISQDVSVAANVVGVLYNKDVGKVITIDRYLATYDTKKLQDKILTFTEDWQFQSMQYDIRDYLESAYLKDNEVKEEVDEEFFPVIKFLE